MLTCTKAMEALKNRGVRVPTVYLDDGHGYDPKTGEATPGKRTPPMPPDGHVVFENQFNSAVVGMVADMLAYHGVRVVFSAPEAADPALNLRVTRVNNDYITQGRPPAVFLSVHYNALNGVFDKKSGGIETFYYTGSVKGEKLARIIHRCVLSGTKQVDRGVKTAGFYVIKYTLMPAALVECGFMDNLVEAGRMLSVPYQLETACELVSGLMEYFGLPMTAGVEAAYRAVTIARSLGRHDDSQYWMDVLMGYANIERGRLCTLMER